MRAASSIRGTRIEVDLGAVAHNLRLARRAAGRAGVLAVVKADGYGHGAVEMARAALAEGAWGLGVATVEEAAELRDAGIAGRIVVLGACYGGAHDEVVRRDLDAVVGGLDDLGALSRVARHAGEPARVHVKIDTGMARLGVPPEQAGAAIERVARDPALRLAGLMTHLACAEDPEEEPTRVQIDRLDAALALAEAAGTAPETVHAANTAALLRFPFAHKTLVRPGIALCGTVPSRAVPDPGLVPAMTLRTEVCALRTLQPGQRVSYGGLWRAERVSRIATLPIGYADGYPRKLTGRARALVRGQRVPIVGAVCMDLCMADVTDVPEAAVGDEVILVGAQGRERIGVAEVAAWADTIPYEIFCGLGRRLPRAYLRGPDPGLAQGGPRAAAR